VEVSGVNINYDENGKSKAKGDVYLSLEVATVGRVTVNLEGFSGSLGGGAPDVSFHKFEAKLQDDHAAREEIAMLVLEFPAEGAKDAGQGKLKARGNTAVLVETLRQHVKDLPPEAQAAFNVVSTMGVGLNVSAEGSV